MRCSRSCRCRLASRWRPSASTTRRTRRRSQRASSRSLADRELVELASALVAIDSVNPDLVPGGAGEAEIAAFVAGWLDRAGLEVDVVESHEGRPSVIGIARGTGGGRALLLNGHVDTVSVDGMDEPFAPRVADGRLYGRGAYDMKAAVAAAM